ncbi:unnamed protein product, partial [Coregonus sp. 'balchen']
GKIVSPKWKSFKGLRLLWRDKIHVEKRKNPAIVLEGSYWKRRIEVVIREYHKWRIYYKKRLQKNKDGLLSMLQ